MLLSVLPMQSQQQEQYTINTKPLQLIGCTTDRLDPNMEPFATGKLTDTDFHALIAYEPAALGNMIPCLVAGAISSFAALNSEGNLVNLSYNITQDERLTIIHILRWADSKHQNVQFQKWYVYDPHRPNPWAYFKADSANEVGTNIDGRQEFRLIIVHFDSSFSPSGESFDSTGAWLFPLQYKISITKAQTQLQQDISALAKITGYSKGGALANLPEVGYYWVYDFKSNQSTSQVTISATLTNQEKSSDKTASPSSTPTAANNIASQSYHNEKPAWFGLSATVPITSYRDLTLSNNQVAPQTVNRQNIYISANLYVPPTEIGGTTVRWLPHPLFGLPLKSQPLRNTLYGFGMGWRWLEPFGGVVLDVQKMNGSTPGSSMNHYVWKGVYGLNISISAASKALSKAVSNSTSSAK
jgi:hypothetical protein